MKKYALTFGFTYVVANAFADMAPDPVVSSDNPAMLFIGLIAVVVLILVIRRMRKIRNR